MAAPFPLQRPKEAARRTPPLVLATLGHVLGTSAQSTFLFLLAPAVSRLRGVSAIDPWVFSLTALATALLAFPAGRLADRAGRRAVMRLGWALMMLASLLVVPAVLGLTPAAATLIVADLLMGSGLAFAWVAFMSYVADLAKGGALARSYGVVAAVSVVSSTLAPFAAAGLIRASASESSGLVAVALMLALMCVTSLLLSLPLAALRAHDRFAAPKRDLARYLWAPKNDADRAVVASNVALLIMGFGGGATIPYFTSYFIDHFGFTAAAWGALLALGTLASGLAAWGVGALVARGAVSRRTALLGIGIGLVAVALPLPFLALSGVAAMLYLARMALGNAWSPVLNEVAMSGAEPDARGEAMGSTVLTWNVGWTLGALAGATALALGGAWLFVGGAVLILLGLAASLALLPRHYAGVAS